MSGKQRWLRWVTFALFGLHAQFSVIAQVGSEVTPPAVEVGTEESDVSESGAKAGKRPKLSEAALSGFAEIKRMDGELKGKRGPERLLALQQIAERCESMAASNPSETAAAARAWFEAGEAWRRHGSIDRAASAYTKSLENDDAKVYQERGHFELAQMQRRQKQWASARENYRKAAAVSPTSNRAHDARVWIARCEAAEGQADSALASFRAALAAAGTPRQRIDAVNWLAKTLVERGEIDAATSLLGDLDRDIGPELASGSKDADALRKLLDKMSARSALRRARDRASGVTDDIRDLEDDVDRGEEVDRQ